MSPDYDKSKKEMKDESDRWSYQTSDEAETLDLKSCFLRKKEV